MFLTYAESFFCNKADFWSLPLIFLMEQNSFLHAFPLDFSGFERQPYLSDTLTFIVFFKFYLHLFVNYSFFCFLCIL